MQLPVSQAELNERIRLNRQRLTDGDYYQIGEVFHGTDDWYGDKEGRALLAFISHYKIMATSSTLLFLYKKDVSQTSFFHYVLTNASAQRSSSPSSAGSFVAVRASTV